MPRFNNMPASRKFYMEDIAEGDYLQTYDNDDGDLQRVIRKGVAEVETIDGFGMHSLYSPNEVSEIFLESEVENNF